MRMTWPAVTVGNLPALWRVEYSGVRYKQGNQLESTEKMDILTASLAVKMNEMEGFEKY